jgi:predicted acylesterase/phospholipase RssA
MLEGETGKDTLFRILSLDGGGAKGFYTLGVLREIEGMIGRPLHERFDLIFGTSTGSIIAALIALGHRVEEICALYQKHVPTIMQAKRPRQKSHALNTLAKEVFGTKKFDAVKTRVGIVAARWVIERPMIFKSDIALAHGRTGTFSPGFGCTIADAVQASCSAYPFFKRKIVKTDAGDSIELVDGGYCANNPTLYAIADATMAMNIQPDKLRVVSVGVGVYPQPQPPLLSKMRFYRRLRSVQLLQKTLEINTQSMDQLRDVLFKRITTVRISDTFEQPEMATDLFEHDLNKLNLLRQRGSESFASRELQLRQFLP